MREAKPAQGLESARSSGGLEKAGAISEKPILKAKKVLIAGYPKVGKTTYARERFGYKVRSTDDYLPLTGISAVHNIMMELNEYRFSFWAIEGVLTVQLFREMLQRNQHLPDLVIWLRPLHPALPKHEAMRKAIDTVWAECLELNKSWGVTIVEEEGR